MRASHTHCTHYADMRAFYEHQSSARTFFPFLRTPALRAVASIGEYWRGPTCSLHAHNACCMRAIRLLQAFCKLWQAFYRAHIFIRDVHILCAYYQSVNSILTSTDLFHPEKCI